MYLNYYNLKSEPFNITPDPELLYLSPSHKEALAAVIYGVSKRKGFVALIGEVGVGKTTIIRSFLGRVKKQTVRTIYIFNANISFKSLLKTMYRNLERVPESDDVCSMVDQLHMILIEEYKAGRNVVLIIDEAQNMPVETLENLRMLSNLETSTDKLVQVILSGQPEFEQMLNSHTLRQLKQRIGIRVKIRPLTRSESLDYISHRLSRTALNDPDIFTTSALSRIVREANGIPRSINILCDNCLITSFGNQQKKVTNKVAKEIIADLRMDGPAKSMWKIPLFISLLSVACAVWIYWQFRPFHPIQEKSAPVHLSNESPAGTTPVQEAPSASIQTMEQQPVETGAEKKTGSVAPLVYRVVKKGDTVAGLVVQTYGSANRELFNLVKRNNPHLANINVIQEGEKLYFPKRDTLVAGEVSDAPRQPGEQP